MEKYIPLAQVEQLIDEMIDTLDIVYVDSSEDWEIRRIYNAMKWILWEAKTKVSSLPTEESGWIRSQEIVKDMINYEVTQREWYTDEREKRNATTCIQILTTAFDRIHKESKPLPKPPLQ